jgi:alpha-tubulin suppressor-like RCC1 family protein
VEALRGVPVGSVAGHGHYWYAVADTGRLWAWRIDGDSANALGHDEQGAYPLFKPMESVRAVKVDAVAVSDHDTLALADDGRLYTWANWTPAKVSALGRALR